jgi:hypothetical protein
MASSKVGHFIYGLCDRVWPDFVCHFSLFRGNHPYETGFSHEPSWWSDEQIAEVAQRNPTFFCPKLAFLHGSSRNDSSLSSRTELDKFGFNL